MLRPPGRGNPEAVIVTKDAYLPSNSIIGLPEDWNINLGTLEDKAVT